MGSSDQQLGLSAQEGGNLQHIDKFGCDVGLHGLVDVGHHGNLEGVAHLAQDAQRFLVTDAGKRVDAGAVGLAVTALEYVGDTQRLRDFHCLLGDIHRHLLALDHAGTGEQEKVMSGR